MNHHINAFAKANVMVLGDVMLDRYWTGTTSRISPEAPVPVVQVKTTHELPGGAGNVALNISALGASCHLLGTLGDDANGERLQSLFTQSQVNTTFEICPGHSTTTKLRLMSQHQQLMRMDFEQAAVTHDLLQIKQQYSKQLPTCQAVVLSDYAKGVLHDPQPYIQFARDRKIPVLIDPKTTDFSRYRGASILTPNYSEFSAVVGTCCDESDLAARGNRLMHTLALKGLLITRGADGMTLLRPKHPPKHYPAQVHEVFDVTGAGDTVIAVLATALAAGIDIESAVDLANMAAGITVTKLGASCISQQELHRAYAEKNTLQQGILSIQTVSHEREIAQLKNEKVVMTNGCFDLLHAGHIAYLKQAKALGDRLLIAVNDDDSVRRLKGTQRPINSLDKRMEVLAALSFVDWVVPFSEDTPLKLIQKIRPDFLVKGGDYTESDVVGADLVKANGGQVVLLDYVPGLSTTAMIDRITHTEETA